MPNPAKWILDAGRLQAGLDAAGRLASLIDTATGRDQLDPAVESPLLTVRLFGEAQPRLPLRALRQKAATDRVRLRLDYGDGIRALLDLIAKPSHLRLTLLEVKDADGNSPAEAVQWGPFNTLLRDAPGEIVGLLRDGSFSLGLLSLEPKTDGAPGDNKCAFNMARWTANGSALLAEARDHTRDGVGEDTIAIRGVPGLTVAGSSAALFGCDTAAELDTLEAVELAEGLPHPLFDGQWVKRAPAARKPALWAHFDENTFAACLELARRMGAGTLCSFHDMFGNWGHFDPDPAAWPSGLRRIRMAAEEARAAGVRLVMYTLSTFLKPRSLAEPYVAPRPDDRLQTMGPATALAAEATADGDTVTLEKREGLLEALRITYTFGTWLEHHEENQVVRVDDEILYYRSVREEGATLILEGCRRGLFFTAPAAHARGARAVRLYLNVFRNFFPGTLSLQDEVAERIARVTREGGFGQIVFDGHESCLETGHGIYARNRFTRQVQAACADLAPLYTGSNLGNYDWHTLSFISWGEFDWEKGIRGTMLDYRIMRQVQLRRNRMPNKMGQYYPSAATLEDVEWMMALACGWEAGLDFHVFPDVLEKNPQKDAILDAIRLWDEARLAGAFTEAQRMAMRQTDRLFTLARDADGAWRLTPKGRWLHPGVAFLPPSAFTVEADGLACSIAPQSLDWSWTHNPGIFAKAGLTDDLACQAGGKPGGWTVTYPAGPNPDALLFVLRVPEDSPCGIRNPKIRLDDGEWITIPAVLQPGQYLSTVHDAPWVCLYDERHEVIGEVHVRGRLAGWPAVSRGNPHRIALEAEPVDDRSAPPLLLNLRTHA